MKKGILFFGLIILLLLTACGKEDVTDYIDISFSGVDSVGKVNYSVDTNQLLAGVFNYDPETDFLDEKQQKEVNAVLSAYKIKVEPQSGLSNGDKVTLTVTVDDKQTKKIKSSEKVITVEDLEAAKDIIDYVTVSFIGLDSQGKVEYDLNEGQLIADIFGQDGMDEEIEAEIELLKSAYTIEVDQDGELSNGDKVKLKVTVDKDQSKLVKSGEKEFTVKELNPATKLTEKEIQKHLVVNFNGISGRGVAKIDNTFSSPLNHFEFVIENDGELKNGDDVTLVWDEEMVDRLNQSNYIVEKDFKPTFKVKGLQVVAEKATDIKNFADVKRMIDEEINRKYKTDSPEDNYGTVYKINEEKVLYRQFDSGSNDTDLWYGAGKASDHGNLIIIYSVEKYNGGKDPELKEAFTAIVGYSGITIDDENNTNVTQMELFHDKRDDSYSKESVIQLYEGYGYTEVKE